MRLTLPQQAWLLGLLALWAGLLFGGFIAGRPKTPGGRRMPTWTRMASSLTLTVAAWSWAWLSRDTGASSFTRLIAAGMTLGLLGDLFLARLLPVAEPFPYGMGAFALNHVAYIAAILSFCDCYGLTALGPRFGAWAAWLLAGLAGSYLVCLRVRRRTPLHWAGVVYSLLLASTAGCAAGLALQEPGFAGLAVGAALFLVSDLILGAGVFGGRHVRRADDLIWLTYGPGQMLIVYASAAALRIASGQGA